MPRPRVQIIDRHDDGETVTFTGIMRVCEDREEEHDPDDDTRSADDADDWEDEDDWDEFDPYLDLA